MFSIEGDAFTEKEARSILNESLVRVLRRGHGVCSLPLYENAGNSLGFPPSEFPCSLFVILGAMSNPLTIPLSLGASNQFLAHDCNVVVFGSVALT
jgi:hypothetical protein